MRLSGVVKSGLGRAHVFMAQTHYQEQFKLILGATAWPGTLNIGVEGKDLEFYVALRNLSGMDPGSIEDSIQAASEKLDVSHIESTRIHGFKREGRSFGGATAFHATIQSTSGDEYPCAILIPDLTRHVDVVEVIAVNFLREGLSIEDGEIVNLNLI